MDACGLLATPPSERNRVFDVIDNSLLQVNYPWCGSREENSQERRKGCGMWARSAKGSKSRWEHAMRTCVGQVLCVNTEPGANAGGEVRGDLHHGVPVASVLSPQAYEGLPEVVVEVVGGGGVGD
jgi:hypothetical protein